MISVTVYQYLVADNLLGSAAEYFAREFALDSAVLQPIKQRGKKTELGKGAGKKLKKKITPEQNSKGWRRAEEENM